MFLWERELREKEIRIGDFEPVKQLGLDSVFDFRMSSSHWLLEDRKDDSTLALLILYLCASITSYYQWQGMD